MGLCQSPRLGWLLPRGIPLATTPGASGGGLFFRLARAKDARLPRNLGPEGQAKATIVAIVRKRGALCAPFLFPDQTLQTDASELSKAIVGILRREGADRIMILGARLGALVREEHGDLLHTEMERQRIRFVQLVEQIAGVRVVRDADTGLDVLIGLEGALPPLPSAEPLALRPDVYAAFTRFGVSYWYDPGTDEFRQGLPGENGVGCPEIRQSDLAELRKGFAETVEEPTRSELLSTLDGQEGSLAGFRQAVLRTRLTTAWEQYRYKTLSETVREWATNRGVEIQAPWFRRVEPAREHRSRPRQILGDLAGIMTDEEARATLIPVSAIERYLTQQQQGLSP